MNKPVWINNTVATICGAIFFPMAVIVAYRFNTYALNGEILSGGRFYWRYLGWTILCSIPFFGIIYALINVSNIVETRNRLWEKYNNVPAHEQTAASV
ncbi:MAG: hypothetical protein LBC73_06435 [Oscillospiraceae bacterium]|jgi:hypothetical protein|nr:hypothetical protein [Oscillospiraceae bacterium]